MTTYFKAVRPDGTDFYTGMVQWVPPDGHDSEWIVRHPTATKIGSAPSGYLSASTAPADCTGMEWPCRLLTVEAVGDVTTPLPITLPHKRAGVVFRVTGELPAHEALGPQGAHVAALLERMQHLTLDEARTLAPTRDAAWDAARDAVCVVERDTALCTALDVAWVASRVNAEDASRVDAWGAMWDAAQALIVRDIITVEDYDILTRPWRTVIGPIHPDDPELATITREDR